MTDNALFRGHSLAVDGVAQRAFLSFWVLVSSLRLTGGMDSHCLSSSPERSPNSTLKPRQSGTNSIPSFSLDALFSSTAKLDSTLISLLLVAELVLSLSPSFPLPFFFFLFSLFRFLPTLFARTAWLSIIIFFFVFPSSLRCLSILPLYYSHLNLIDRSSFHTVILDLCMTLLLDDAACSRPHT
ncbi:uncharacterized protein BO87DRAFT_85465 [Aspergillus neoniger CBS 115656]|uniref:Uncharacterized protein n=1 Tax=Aspergillus neoniger (strain CBS 115656) TaxID=1448310 RepID=A0A318YFI0_ASPNB|nr:hypothetical protein BO87DRAFT_85465 [Aspergillus neoniger CBS 115656]PYH33255.1 hypothetical protein BO87DRAFT_85465 [Aspergillus neoniger CBS 115656]